MIKVSCTWGEGPDILLTFKEHGIVLYEDPDKTGFVHGHVNNASTDLRLDQAKLLVASLQMAIQHVEELEYSLEEYFKNEENNKQTNIFEFIGENNE